MTRIEQLQKKLSKRSVALITSDVNRRYFTGLKSTEGVVLVFPDYACLLVDFRYTEKAKNCVTDCEVIETDDFYGDINSIILKHKAKNVMVESRKMTLYEVDELWQVLDDSLETDTSNLLSDKIDAIRRIKTEEDIADIIRAQRIAEAAFENTLNIIREGVTEREIALSLNDYMLRHGGEDVSFETIALSGINTAQPHGTASDKPVRRGEFVLMDFGAVYNGWHSDMTRTVCVGEPTEEMEKVYGIVLEAQKRSLDSIRAGLTVHRYDQVARDFIAANGYGDCFGHGLGHCVGMEIHEEPFAAPGEDGELRENMVITCEPGIYIPKKFGVRIEDFVVIKQNSAFNLTNAPKNLIKL